jgi:thiamine kinase-like enzyme
MDLSPTLFNRLEALFESTPLATVAISGGYSPAKRLQLTLADGRRIFAKIVSNQDTASWLRKEFRIYSYLASELKADFVPGLLGWLAKALPVLFEAESKASLKGDKLVHFDVRSDNICFYGERTLFVDWNWACVGNSELDLLAWLPSVNLEGGPPPETLAPDADANLVALMTGYWASVAGLAPPHTGSKVREIQLAQLKTALPWCIKVTGQSAN